VSVFAFALQQSQLSQQLFPSSVAETAVAVPSFFFIGHESPQQSHLWFSAVALPSFDFIGQLSPQHLCSPFACSPDLCSSCFIIGHESFLQHDALSATLLTARLPYANAAIAKLKTVRIANANKNFLFMTLFSNYLTPVQRQTIGLPRSFAANAELDTKNPIRDVKDAFVLGRAAICGNDREPIL
jgi:hypothetical protein